MTSNSSGYITVAKNECFSESPLLKKIVIVPAENTVFVSIKETGAYTVDVDLYRYFLEYDADTGLYRQKCQLVWYRTVHYESDFLHVFQATKFTVEFSIGDCANTDYFKLFFSFVHKNSVMQKLPNGQWNCSVSYYPSIHHHVACNHKTECEDGRDETEHCPFSSPECKGLVALCSQCYRFVQGVNTSPDKETGNYMKIGTEYCKSLGATFSFPKCPFDWPQALFHSLRRHNIFVGFYGNDLSLPSMYRHAMLDDKTVIHHPLSFVVIQSGEKICYHINADMFKKAPCNLSYNRMESSIGVSCELRVNRTEENGPHSQKVSSISRHFPLPSEQQDMTICATGHMTYTAFFCGSDIYRVCSYEQSLSCHVPGKSPGFDHPSLAVNHVLFPLFQCSDEQFTLSYSLICDFIADCKDKTDESLCKHPVCLNTFTCTSGQCVSYSKVCDQIPHCQDESDENSCDEFVEVTVDQVYLPFPALINFDLVRQFTIVPLYSNDSCPDSHYRCPSNFTDCLPVYTRCNGMFDCLDHQDEEGCEDLRCPGFFRCRVSMLCIHHDHLCDGWPHCALRDDELFCDTTCPVGCACQGHSFLCVQPFSTTLFPQLRYLDATGSDLTLSDVNPHDLLFHLILARCALTLLPPLLLPNLKILDLSDNQLQSFNVTSLLSLHNLQALFLSKNPLTSIHVDDTADLRQGTLTELDLSYTSLQVCEEKYFSLFIRLQKLNLTSTSIHTISPNAFQSMPHLTALHMEGSPIEQFPPDLFKDLNHLRLIVTDNYKLCCDDILSCSSADVSCHAPKSALSSCKDLLQSWTYRGFLWLIACLSVTGNVFCFCVRLFAKSMSSSSGFSVFVANLTMSDFLMGVYIAIIGLADEQFRGTYLHHDSTWKSSVMCKVAGVLSLISSEVSALVIWVITLDRFVVLHFPFSTLRFDRVSAAVACLLIWLVGWCLAMVPLLPVTLHWNFYGQTGICIPLPVTTRGFKGRYYSFSVLIGFNFVLFLIISVGQALIYWSIQTNAMKTSTGKASRDMVIARRLITVAVTDFMCWFPIGICGLLALAGATIPGEVNVALAIFVLPLNSAVNPFMYTFNTLAEKRKKSVEAKLVKWLESHAEVATSP